MTSILSTGTCAPSSAIFLTFIMTATTDQYTAAVHDLIKGANIETAVSKLTRPTLDAISKGSDDQVESSLTALWSAVIRAARETSDEDVHDRLITGLREIKSLPPALVRKNGEKEQYSNWGGRVWDDLPIFGAQVREEWNCKGFIYI